MRGWFFAAAFAAWSCVGCGSTPVPLAIGHDCTPGASVACTCPGGASGGQVCRGDGSGYYACECERDGDVASVDGSDAAMGIDAGNDSALAADVDTGDPALSDDCINGGPLSMCAVGQTFYQCRDGKPPPVAGCETGSAIGDGGWCCAENKCTHWADGDSYCSDHALGVHSMWTCSRVTTVDEAKCKLVTGTPSDEQQDWCCP